MRRYSISSAFLKHIAYLTMFIDHFSVVVLGAYVQWLSVQRAPAGTAAFAYHMGRHVGRIAFILFAFMASEGFRYTHSRKSYLLRLFAFALISEVPFDLAIENSLFSMEAQNVYWTLFLGILALCFLEKLHEKPLFQVLGVLLCCVAAVLLKTDYMIMGVLLIVVFYLCRGSFRHQFVFGSCTIYAGQVMLYVIKYWGKGIPLSVYMQASTSELYGLFAFCFIYYYNGKKGRQLPKAFYYWFYPLHLLLLYGIKLILFPGA